MENQIIRGKIKSVKKKRNVRDLYLKAKKKQRERKRKENKIQTKNENS